MFLNTFGPADETITEDGDNIFTITFNTVFILVSVNAAEIRALSQSLDGKRFGDINGENGDLEYRLSEYVIVEGAFCFTIIRDRTKSEK